MIEIILFTVLGVAIGAAMGLIPGMNINNILPLLLSLIIFFPNPYYFVALIVAIAITQNFMSFIPAIFFGAPEADTSLSVMPGHKLMLEGKGYEAIKLTVIGGMGALFGSLAIILIFSQYFSTLYDVSRPYIQYAILAVIIFMIMSGRKLKKMLATTAILAISGLLGMLTLGSSFANQQNILFPVLGGLFGLSTLVISISQKAKIPEQKESGLLLSKGILIKSIALGSIAGVVVGFLPAIGVSQAATMVQYFGGVGDPRGFLTSLGGVNIANEVFSLSSLYLIDNPRSGASVYISRVLEQLSFYDLLLIIGMIMFASGLAAILTLYLGRRIPRLLARMNYRAISIGAIVLLVGMMYYIVGPLGLLVAFVATAIGVLCASMGVSRSNCMGVLLVPSVFFFSGLNPLIISGLNL